MKYLETSITKIALLIAVISLFIGLAVTAEAKAIVRSGDEVSITEDQKIEGDFYSTAGVVNISGEIIGDAVIASGGITLNGTIGEDALLFGGSVDIHGTIGDDLRVIGGDVTIAEPVLGDVFIVGGSVTILSTASVAGDVVVFAANVEINGPVEGNVLGHVSNLRIDTRVAGDVDVTTEQLTLGDKAVVSGSVRYVSQNLIVRAQNAAVEKDVVRNDSAFETPTFSFRDFLVPILIILFSVALWYLLARRMLTRVVNRALAPGIRPILVGVLTVFLAPFAAAILMASMLGMIAGIALLLAYLLFFLLAIVATPAVIGQLIMNIATKQITSPTLLSLLIGSAVFGICAIIPVVGPVALIGFYLLTFGSIIDLLLRSNR